MGEESPLRSIFCRLRVFDNRVLRRIFGPKRDKVTRKWEKLHNEELNDLYSTPIIVWVKKIENDISRACSTCGGEERHIKGSGGKT